MAVNIEAKTFLDEEGLNAYHNENMQKIANDIESHNSSSTSHSDMRGDISNLKKVSHEHDNLDILDGTTAPFTLELKNKLDNIENNANKIVIDPTLSLDSTNPVENQAITNWLAKNVKTYKLNGVHNGALSLMDNDVSTIASAPEAPGGSLQTVYTVITDNGDEFIFGTHWDSIKDIPFASTTTQGIVQLTNSTTSTSTTTAATPNSVKQVRDLTNANLEEAKTYADNAANTVKNDLLNGAGEAYDTLKELGDLINDNTTALDALEDVATGKADKVHNHNASDIEYGAPAENFGGTTLEDALMNLDENLTAFRNEKVSQTIFNAHTSNSNIHFTTQEKDKLSNIEDNANYYVHPKYIAPPDDGETLYKFELDGQGHIKNANCVEKDDLLSFGLADADVVDHHIADSTKHITSTERTNWNAAKTHADLEHVTGVKGSAESSYRVGDVNITKANIGLGNVDNTSDINKPISNAQQQALDELSAETVRLTEEGIINMADSSSSIRNLLPIATDENGNVYNGTGYKNGYRWSSSINGESSASGYGITGYIPCSYLDTIRLKNITPATSSSPYIVCFNSSKTLLGLQTINIGSISPDATGVYSITLSVQPNTAFVRLSFCSFNENSIVTVNQDFALTGSATYGWLTDYNGNKISPRVLTDYVTTVDGITIDEVILEKADETLMLAKKYTNDNTVTLDSTLSLTSKNAIENQAVTNWLADNVRNYHIAFGGSGISGYAYLSNNPADVVASAPAGTDTVYYIENGEETRYFGVLWDNIDEVPYASTNEQGIVQLIDSTSSTSKTTAATPNSVKSAYDLANQAKTAAENAQNTADSKADAVHTHNDIYYTESEIDKKFEDTASYIDESVSDLISGVVADNKISAHNTSVESHNDIRTLIDDLTVRLNALANSDDTTLDQLSEVVAYIKSNRSLIEEITTNKVNVEDIINNLTTNVNNKPLSAAQGVVIKKLIDDLQEEVDDNLEIQTNHINNKSNPHSVTLNQLGVTVSSDELNHMEGITSNVQTQLNNKSATGHGHVISDIANLESTLDSKQPNITGGASTITSSNLTANRALLSNGSGKVSVSSVTNTELGYLSGTTSNVQTQLNSRLKYSNTGTVGQFAVSDGNGGVTWLTVKNGNEVAY